VACLSQPTFLFEPASQSVSPGANVFFQSVAFAMADHFPMVQKQRGLAGEIGDFLF